MESAYYHPNSNDNYVVSRKRDDNDHGDNDLVANGTLLSNNDVDESFHNIPDWSESKITKLAADILYDLDPSVGSSFMMENESVYYPSSSSPSSPLSSSKPTPHKSNSSRTVATEVSSFCSTTDTEIISIREMLRSLELECGGGGIEEEEEEDEQKQSLFLHTEKAAALAEQSDKIEESNLQAQLVDRNANFIPRTMTYWGTGAGVGAGISKDDDSISVTSFANSSLSESIITYNSAQAKANKSFHFTSEAEMCLTAILKSNKEALTSISHQVQMDCSESLSTYSRSQRKKVDDAVLAAEKAAKQMAETVAQARKSPLKARKQQDSSLVKQKGICSTFLTSSPSIQSKSSPKQNVIKKNEKWIPYWCEEYCREYYFHPESRKVVWDIPKDCKDEILEEGKEPDHVGRKKYVVRNWSLDGFLLEGKHRKGKWNSNKLSSITSRLWVDGCDTKSKHNDNHKRKLLHNVSFSHTSSSFPKSKSFSKKSHFNKKWRKKISRKLFWSSIVTGAAYQLGSHMYSFHKMVNNGGTIDQTSLEVENERIVLSLDYEVDTLIPRILVLNSLNNHVQHNHAEMQYPEAKDDKTDKHWKSSNSQKKFFEKHIGVKSTKIKPIHEFKEDKAILKVFQRTESNHDSKNNKSRSSSIVSMNSELDTLHEDTNVTSDLKINEPDNYSIAILDSENNEVNSLMVTTTTKNEANHNQDTGSHRKLDDKMSDVPIQRDDNLEDKMRKAKKHCNNPILKHILPSCKDNSLSMRKTWRNRFNLIVWKEKLCKLPLICLFVPLCRKRTK